MFFIVLQNSPHLLLHGPPGIGKTSVIIGGLVGKCFSLSPSHTALPSYPILNLWETENENIHSSICFL